MPTFTPKMPDLKAKFAEAQANRERLDACARHHFSLDIPGIEGGVGSMFGKKLECDVCKGQMDLVALNYYVRGYEAAGRSGNDILPGWREAPNSDETPRRKFFGTDED